MLLNVTVERVSNKTLGSDDRLEQGLRERVFRFAKFSADVTTSAIEIESDLGHPYKVIDRDIDQLKTLGYSEDQLLKMRDAIALDAGSGRLSLTLRLIEEGQR